MPTAKNYNDQSSNSFMHNICEENQLHIWNQIEAKPYEQIEFWSLKFSIQRSFKGH